MPRGRPPRHPSGRNLLLYHECICERRLQAQVAAQFRVSQARVAQICRQVIAWVENSLAGYLTSDSPPLDAGQKLHLAIALHRHQLSRAYDEYLAYFGGPARALAHGHLLAAIDAQVLPKAAVPGLPRRGLVQIAVRMARELEELAAVAQRGPFFHLPAQSPQAAGPKTHSAAVGI